MNAYIKQTIRLITYGMFLGLGVFLALIPFIKKDREFTTKLEAPLSTQEVSADVAGDPTTGGDGDGGGDGGDDGDA